ncbi:basic helix-loop-helix transcription factor scleraxis-like [Toxorhynchites rutilus septentrionalis]|uniref:basic helix-loop-helix transcription factor scleraxis-like n=1 Tax=Toxorhynchites rutilus septentrionalis TaxID=329112 RepID=UPI00247915C1|nr:basic helix-loop-helix transcription factor scleraxis-like [Toxorhynchites rutilus septentrionalis]
MSGRNRKTSSRSSSASQAMESAYEECFFRLESSEGELSRAGGQCQRSQANARERYRTHSVNSAFSNLRMLIPTEPKNRKLSKIETLRLAKSYISHLIAVLLTGNLKQPCLLAQTTPHISWQSYGEDLNESGSASEGSHCGGSRGSPTTNSEMTVENFISTMSCGEGMRANICTFCITPKKVDQR